MRSLRESLLPQRDPACSPANDIVPQQAGGDIRNALVNAGPGCGKTYVALRLLYALSYGCFAAEWCANNAETAYRSGGVNTFHLFCFEPPARAGVVYNAAVQASQGLRKLACFPERRLWLQRLSVLIIDEVSQVSAELLNAMDMVLQNIRGLSRPFGGCLVIALGDNAQLPPVTGTFVYDCFLLRDSADVFQLRQGPSADTSLDPYASRHGAEPYPCPSCGS
eukprot:TRINITY_DN59605_c0_g1_i1.p2 TRINITY_DN59605_c0_g1~~TRINITY_DN59605_c0_g1_i1.p2  ORF type:complete len:222 (-),score=19.12 TRINITY_DN59605_c0_g1_i1:823-1488(-)